MPFTVTTSDVESRWRALSADESAVAAVLLDDLKNDLELRRPALLPLLDDLSGGDAAAQAKAAALQRTITAVLANATKTALRNPDTLRSTTIGADGSIGVGYDNSTEALANTRAALSRTDLADIDKATQAVGGEIVTGGSSVRLQAYPERYAPPNMNVLPLA